jgi:hypothetical protein
MTTEELKTLNDAYEKVSDAILELIRTKLLTGNTSEEYFVSMTYSKYRAKSDFLKMLNGIETIKP